MSWDDSEIGTANSEVQLVGRSPKMQEVGRLIHRIATTDISVVICGESGSGKEVAARLIHRNSLRKEKPFLKVNCASIPDDLLVSELFGFERGSFTGAYKSKPGMLEQADKGTILLDEISAMPLSLQPKLLQVLQDKQFARLGAQKEIGVDVRFISSTNRPLEKLVSERKFREDLYYRLNVITVHMPPLRERKADIPELADFLVRKHSAGLQMAPFELPANVMKAFLQYDWPGNVRELENAVRRLLVTGTEAGLMENFPFELGQQELEPLEPVPEDLPVLSIKEAARQAARQAERDMILMALRKTDWNRKRAAELLQISYKAMLYKLKDAGLAKHSETANWGET